MLGHRFFSIYDSWAARKKNICPAPCATGEYFREKIVERFLLLLLARAPGAVVYPASLKSI